MGLLETMRGWFGLNETKVEPSRSERLDEARFSTSTGVRDDGFRSIYQRLRDLTPYQHAEHLRVCRDLWQANPLAKRAVQIITDLVVSNGIEIVATSKNEASKAIVQAEIDEIDLNLRLSKMFAQRVQELTMFGELTQMQFTREWDGRVKLGFVQPESIDHVEANPADAEDLRFVVLNTPVTVRTSREKPTDLTDDQTAERMRVNGEWLWEVRQTRFRIVHEVQRQNGRTLEGDVFHFGINRLSGATRGLSDLLPVADWLDRFMQLLGSECDRARLLKAFLFHAKLAGADEAEVERYTQKLRKEAALPPKPGTTLITSDKVSWEAVSPDLKTADMIELLRLVMEVVLGALGIPLHFWSSGENSNRATADAQSVPVFASVRRRQDFVRDMYHDQVRFCLQQIRRERPTCQLARVPEEDLCFEVRILDVDRRQYAVLGSFLQQLVAALVQAEAAGYVSSEEAGRMFRDSASALGFEFDEADRKSLTHEEQATPMTAAQALLRKYMAKQQPRVEPTPTAAA